MKEWKERKGKKEWEKGKVIKWDDILGERGRKCVKRNKNAWLATRKENIFIPTDLGSVWPYRVFELINQELEA